METVVVVEQLNIARLEHKIHSEKVAHCQGCEGHECLFLQGSQPRNLWMTLGQVVVGRIIADRQETLQ